MNLKIFKNRYKMNNLIRHIKNTFYNETGRPTKILLVGDGQRTNAEKLSSFETESKSHISFLPVEGFSGVYYTTYSGNNVPTGRAIEKLLGHDRFILTEITHHKLV
jgi:hypothetical protein